MILTSVIVRLGVLDLSYSIFCFVASLLCCNWIALTLSSSERGFDVLELGGGSGMQPCAGFPPAGISASSTLCSHPRYLPIGSGSPVMIPFLMSVHLSFKWRLGPASLMSSTYTISIRSGLGCLKQLFQSGMGTKPTEERCFSACCSQ